MKTVFAVITLFIVSPLHSQIEALFDLKKFHSSESNYIETYLFIYGNTLFENQDSNFNNKGVEVLQYIENEKKQIIAHEKYIIKEQSDYVEKEGIIDLQRFPVSNGKFTIFLEIKDINDSNNTEKYQEEFSIFDSDEPYFSDLFFENLLFYRIEARFFYLLAEYITRNFLLVNYLCQKHLKQDIFYE